ncbi:MAG: matrixin family metalloprotease [Pyrinomonadaceae bacterium]
MAVKRISTRNKLTAKRLSFLTVLIVVLTYFHAPCLGYTYQYADASGLTPLRWPVQVINISFAPSLSAPPANIKINSDVRGAARRALARWSEVTGFQFIESAASAQNVSPASTPDGINLITVAQTTENASLFGFGSETTSRARVFFNPVSGAISEADITINPQLPYSTDGTPGTYDLEGVFVHEIGHLLGLDHSAIVGSTMQPLQGRNGNYNLPAITSRTLSADDRAGIQALYGKPGDSLSISGTVTNLHGVPIFGAHVWAESLNSGRIIAGALSRPDGGYLIEGLVPDQYRVVVSSLNGPISAGNLVAGNRLYRPSQSIAFLAAEATTSSGAHAIANVNFTVVSGQPTSFLNFRYQRAGLFRLPLARAQHGCVGGPGIDQIFARQIAFFSLW